jgi:hypothetical protein
MKRCYTKTIQKGVTNIMTYKQETIVEELHKGVCTVVFTKTDGTNRTMKCTLNPTYAPSMPEFINEDNGKARSIDAVAVWDTDVNGWRSFRLDSILEFNSPQLLNG